MRGHDLSRAACLLLLLSTTAPDPASAAAQSPDITGTWWVLIHYRKPDSIVAHRWYWDERVWIIEREADGYVWTDHPIVSFDDKTGRFEHLGTNRARRLVGAWTPNREQKEQLESGITVDRRGSRRKLLQGNPTTGWKSAPTSGGQRGTASYAEEWQILPTQGLPEFIQAAQIQHWASAEDLGASRHRVKKVRSGGRELSGSYSRADGDRRGRFRMVRTRIREDALDQQVASDSDLDLVPDRLPRPDQTATSLLLEMVKPRFYFDEREASIDSTPPGAAMELVYLRGGGQLVRREGRAPLVVSLPSRSETAEDDAVVVYASLPGRERTRASFPSLSVPDEIHVELQPVENQLLSVAHGHLAGRSVLQLKTQEVPNMAVDEDEQGYTVLLARTGVSEEVMEHLASLSDPLMVRLRAHQLGEDLLLRIGLARNPDGVRVRHFELADAVRRVHRTRLELTDLEAEEDRTSWLLQTLESLDARELPRCAAAFEAEIRRHLDPEDLASALSFHESAEARVLRAALRRYAAVSDPSPLTTLRGEQLVATNPLEFELAATQASEIRGYLAWLRLLSERLDPGDSGAVGLRSLIAPELPPEVFALAFGQAQAAERHCARLDSDPG